MKRREELVNYHSGNHQENAGLDIKNNLNMEDIMADRLKSFTATELKEELLHLELWCWRIIKEIEIALKESLKLQSHYATILNQYDGGKRIVFNSPEEWIERLRKVGMIQQGNSMNIDNICPECGRPMWNPTFCIFCEEEKAQRGE